MVHAPATIPVSTSHGDVHTGCSPLCAALSLEDLSVSMCSALRRPGAHGGEHGPACKGLPRSRQPGEQEKCGEVAGMMEDQRKVGRAGSGRRRKPWAP